MRKRRWERKAREGQKWRSCHFNRVVREGLTRMGKYAQKLTKTELSVYVNNSILGRAHSKCDGPEIGIYA